MAEVVEYYQEYLNLKAHFNVGEFQYGKNFIPFLVKWNREPQLRKDWWNRMRLSMTILEFRKMVIAHLLDNPKIYFMNLGKKSDITINFNKYWSNYLYWFEKDLKSTYVGRKEFKQLLKEGVFNLSTATLIWRIDEEIIESDKIFWEEYGFRIRKFYELIKDKIDWEAVKKIKEKIS